MAEGLARELFGKTDVFSRGISAQNGGTASPQAVWVMSDVYGIDLSGHVPQRLTEADVYAAEVIFTMTEAHKGHISKLFPAVCDKLFTVGDEDISDPFMSDVDVYAACAEEIKKCLETLYGPASQ